MSGCKEDPKTEVGDRGEVACYFYKDLEDKSKEPEEIFKNKFDISVDLNWDCYPISFTIKDITMEWEAFSGWFE